ncbi:MAG: type IV pilin protein [Silvanigrellaceae bacterium]
MNSLNLKRPAKVALSGTAGTMAGFTLVELMVVVAIIGILAAVAGPRVQAFRARGVQSEAKANLNSIYLAQSAYQDAKDQFFEAGANGAKGAVVKCSGVVGADCGTDFAFRQLPGSKYDYQVIGSSGSWAALAVSKQQILNAKTDVWRINASKTLCSPQDAVTKKDATANNCANQTATVDIVTGDEAM